MQGLGSLITAGLALLTASSARDELAILSRFSGRGGFDEPGTVRLAANEAEFTRIWDGLYGPPGRRNGVVYAAPARPKVDFDRQVVLLVNAPYFSLEGEYTGEVKPRAEDRLAELELTFRVAPTPPGVQVQGVNGQYTWFVLTRPQAHWRVILDGRQLAEYGD